MQLFLDAYGEQGDWVRLFSRSTDYLGSKLWRDVRDPFAFLTIDTWRSEAGWLEFQRQFAGDYEELDQRCEQLTEKEQNLACFETIAK